MMTGSVASDGQTPRHMFWRRQYRDRRYARHLSQPELNKRIRDVFLNLLRVTPEGKVGLPAMSEGSVIWMEKWTHVLEEMQLRFGPFPCGFTREILHSEPFPNLACDLARNAARKLYSLGLQNGDVFIKFGKRAHMEALYEAGQLRIQPASFFLKMDHNGAVRDDELTLPVSVVLSRDDVLKIVINPQDVPPDAPEQRVDIQFHWPTDYWLYCVTNSVDARLFIDFGADACVIIRDRQAFSHMLQEAGEENLAGAIMREGPAMYIDPLLPRSHDIFVPLCKHFGYSYQDEYRFCWLPHKPVQKLAHVDVQIGDLKGIADLIVL